MNQLDYINVICSSCGDQKHIQFRMLKIRGINADEYKCPRCSRNYKKSIISDHIVNSNKSRGFMPSDMVDVRCSLCDGINTIQVSALYKNLKNNKKYRCNKCAYDETEEKRLSNLKEKMGTKEVRRKLSQKNYKLWEDEEYRNKMQSKPPLANQKHLRELYDRFGTIKDIADYLGCSLGHVYRLMKNYDITLIKKELINKRKLQRLYLEKKMSTSEIADMYKCSGGCILALLKKHDIVRRSWRDASLNRSGKISQQMKKQWQDSGYRQKMSGEFDTVKEKMQHLSSSQFGRISSIQKVLYSILDDLGIAYEEEIKIGFWTYDCLLMDYNIVVECQGNYWHSLPRAKRNDKAKATYLKEYFSQYKLKYIWEHEFKCKEKVIDLIKYWAGINTEKIDYKFDDLRIDDINREDLELFLNKYHYAGYVNKSGQFYACYVNSDVAASCAFTPLTRKESAVRLGGTSKNTVELSRFCIHPKYQKKNLASWFISRCLKRLNNKVPNIKYVVSFADMTYNHLGTVYKSTNWRFDGSVKPSYWYADKDGYVMHKKTLWDHAKKLKMGENEYATKYNYRKVEGMEKYRYIYELKNGC